MPQAKAYQMINTMAQPPAAAPNLTVSNELTLVATVQAASNRTQGQISFMERVIGHRGAAAYAPENTIASFEKAFELGCRFIEFDVMLSIDGDAFIFHDETLKRTTNGRGNSVK